MSEPIMASEFDAAEENDAAPADRPVSSASSYVQSLERGLAVIKAFDADHPQLTLSDVARITGITRAAARRFLRTLVELGYVRADGRYFTLLPKVLEIGYAYLSALSVPEVAMPHLRELSSSVQESSYLSVLNGYDTVCVAHVPMRRIWSVSFTIGTTLPALTTAAGRAMLASHDDMWLESYLASAQLRATTSHTITSVDALRTELVRVRRQGWALVDQELEEGLCTLAAPIHDKQGQVVAAVSFSTLADDTEPDSLQSRFLRPLLACRAAIEADLRNTHPGH